MRAEASSRAPRSVLAVLASGGCLLGLCLALAGCGASGDPEVIAAIAGDESIMRQKEHGTCPRPPMNPLRWNADYNKADQICCFNRHWAERAGYWESTSFLQTTDASSGETTFYDSVTGKPLFIAPRGRSFADFVQESREHGWPSFRDEELVRENVRVLSDGEAVSVDGTHLGHNLPDSAGNRFCINIVSVAGMPPTSSV